MAPSARLTSFFSFSLRPFLFSSASTSTSFSLCSLTTPRAPLLRSAFYSTHSRPLQHQRSVYHQQQLRTHLHSFQRPSHSKLFSTSSTTNMRVIPVPVLEGKAVKKVSLIYGSLLNFITTRWACFWIILSTVFVIYLRSIAILQVVAQHPF